ncbi:Bacteriohemerythrin [Azospirillaceae bacterium]
MLRDTGIMRTVMALLEWNNAFSTGIAPVDHEHQILIKLINDLAAVMENSPTDGCCGCGDNGSAVLSQIHDAISAHFALEEKAMRDRSYDGYAEHKADHERLLDDIRDIMEIYEAGGYASCRDELATRMRDWFGRHFQSMDARFHN